MRARYEDLSPALSERLLTAQRQGGLGQGSFYMVRSRVWLLWVGLAATVIGGLCVLAAWTSYHDSSEPARFLIVPCVFAVLGLFYGPLALIEYLRLLQAPLKSFTLLTPTNLVECRGSQRPLIFHRLADATDFKQVNEYSRERWKGMHYTFAFGPREQVRFLIKDRASIRVVDEIVELARVKGRGEALPDWPGAREPDLTPAAQDLPLPGFAGQLFNPASEVWIVAGALLLIAFLILLVVTRR